MLRILTPDQYQTTPWKNGGGVTHEIARHGSGDTWHWRLSIAEVASDGPFSHFPGMSRVLTVIEGAGVDLQSPQGTQKARLHHPVHFPGDLDVTGRLVGGTVRDLNLIYDAKAYSAEVRVTHGPGLIAGGAGTTGFLCLSGTVTLAGHGVPVGAFAFAADADITLGADAAGILVTLHSLT